MNRVWSPPTQNTSETERFGTRMISLNDLRRKSGTSSHRLRSVSQKPFWSSRVHLSSRAIDLPPGEWRFTGDEFVGHRLGARIFESHTARTKEIPKANRVEDAQRKDFVGCGVARSIESRSPTMCWRRRSSVGRRALAIERVNREASPNREAGANTRSPDQLSEGHLCLDPRRRCGLCEVEATKGVG